MRIYVVGKMNALEYTARVLIKVIFKKSDNVKVIFKDLESFSPKRPYVLSEFEEVLNEYESNGEKLALIILSSCKSQEFLNMLSRLPSSVYKLVMESDYNKKLRLGNTYVVRYKYDNYLHQLITAISEMDVFKEIIDQEGFGNILDFSLKFSRTMPSSYISRVFIQELGKPKEEGAPLKEVQPLNRDADNLLGIKISLFANYKRIDKYYNWLSMKFEDQEKHKSQEYPKDFFTERELDVIQSSLDYRIKVLRESLSNLKCEYRRRLDEYGRPLDVVMFIDTPRSSKTMNEVLLRLYYAGFKDELVVCTRGTSSCIMSQMNQQALQNIFKEYGVDSSNLTEVSDLLCDCTIPIPVVHRVINVGVGDTLGNPVVGKVLSGKAGKVKALKGKTPPSVMSEIF